MKYYHKIWLVMVFGWVTNYMVRNGLSPVLIPIMDEFGLSHAEAGFLATAFFYSYTMMQLPAGNLGDRLGKKTIVVLAALGWAISSLVTGMARSFVWLLAFRFMTGMAQGSYFSNDRTIIAAYTPKEKMGIGQGVSFTGLGIGMAVGVSLAGVIAQTLGWRWVFYLYSLPALAAALVLLKVVKEPPRPSESAHQERVPYRLVFQHKDIWLYSLGGIAAIYVLWVLATWAPAMFQEIGVKELALASTYSSLLGIAAVPGLLLAGWFSDWMVRRGKGRKAQIAGQMLLTSICVALIGMAIQGRASPWVLAALFFLAGFFFWGIWAPTYALLPEMVPPQVLGTAYGLINTVHFTGSLVAPWLTGLIKDITLSFAWGAYIAAIVSVVGAVFFLAIKPSFRLGPEHRIALGGLPTAERG
ncbi:MAG: MFS transporter [Dehalococcoidia bacterium]|nr:MFS transporter [Dehalococcoidia bacterium]